MPTDPKYLRDFACFQNLTEDQMAAVARLATAVCYPPHHILFREGEPGERLFFMLKGEVEVLYQIGAADQERVDIVAGEEIVGCSALIKPYVYTATERSLTEIEVLEINAGELRQLMEEDYALGYTIQQQALSFLMDRIIDLRLAR